MPKPDIVRFSGEKQFSSHPGEAVAVPLVRSSWQPWSAQGFYGIGHRHCGKNRLSKVLLRICCHKISIIRLTNINHRRLPRPDHENSSIRPGRLEDPMVGFKTPWTWSATGLGYFVSKTRNFRHLPYMGTKWCWHTGKVNRICYQTGGLNTGLVS